MRKNMIDMTTGEMVVVIKKEFLDKEGFICTVEYVQDKMGELTPKWQYGHELKAV